MKYVTLFCGLFGMLCADFTLSNDTYSISFPEKPEMSTKENLQTWYLERDSGSLTFSVITIPEYRELNLFTLVSDAIDNSESESMWAFLKNLLSLSLSDGDSFTFEKDDTKIVFSLDCFDIFDDEDEDYELSRLILTPEAIYFLEGYGSASDNDFTAFEQSFELYPKKM